MIYIFLLLVSLGLYSKHRAFSVLMGIVFSLSGMRMMPSILNDGVKASDMGIIYIVLIVFYHLLNRTKGFFALDPLGKRLFYLLVFFLFATAFSTFYYGIPIIKVLIVVRTYLYFLFYFILRNLKLAEVQKIFKWLATLTFVTCILYVIQIPTGITILFGDDEVKSLQDNSAYSGLARFVNIPDLRDMFFFVALFCNLNFGWGRLKWKRILYPLSILLSFGRTAIGLSFSTALLGVGLKRRNYIKWIALALIILSPLISLVQGSFAERNSGGDFELIEKGEYRNYQTGYKSESTTLLYRVAWVYERASYLAKQNIAEQCFGLGLISDQDPDALRMYPFQVRGYGGEFDFQILYSYDIGWGNLVTRFGILGSISLLSIWIYLGLFFWKRRNNELMFASFLYWLFFMVQTISGQGFSETRNLIPFYVLYVLYTKSKQEGRTKLTQREK